MSEVALVSCFTAKEAGNELFKAGDANAAIERWSEALAHLSSQSDEVFFYCDYLHNKPIKVREK